MLTYGSLFSGIDGLGLAVEQVTGATAAWHSEIEPGPCEVLARWPGVPNLGDITAIDWADVPPVDILCGGFPCQDISTAGRGAGIKEGTRSGLWHRYGDAVRVLRPRYVFVENVAALAVRGLDIVCATLAELGYDARWTCLRASDVGAPHQRNRLWLVAADADEWRRDGWRAGGTDGARDRDEGRVRWSTRAGSAVADASHVGHERGGPARRRRHGPADSGDAATDASGERLGQHPGGPSPQEARTRRGDITGDHRGERPPFDWRATPYAAAITRWERITGHPAPDPTDDRGRLNPRLPEWMMGFEPGWATDLLGRTAALKAIGNAVCPQQAVAAYTLLLDAMTAEQAA